MGKSIWIRSARIKPRYTWSCRYHSRKENKNPNVQFEYQLEDEALYTRRDFALLRQGVEERIRYETLEITIRGRSPEFERDVVRKE